MNLTTLALSTVLATSVSILPNIEPANAVNVKFQVDHIPSTDVNLDQNAWVDNSEIINSANSLTPEYTWEVYDPLHDVNPNYFTHFDAPPYNPLSDTYLLGFRFPLEPGVYGLYVEHLVESNHYYWNWMPEKYSFTAFEVVDSTPDFINESYNMYSMYFVPGVFDWNAHYEGTYYPSPTFLKGTYAPTEPVPEPITIIGTLAALGFGLAFKKKASLI